MIKSILSRAVQSHKLEEEEIILLLTAEGKDKERLFEKADFIREKYLENKVFLRGIIEFSNYCRRNCFYCGLRRDNKNLIRYRLKAEEIIEMAVQGVMLGYKTIVLQSGEDDFYDGDIIAWIIKKIKEKADTAITLCLGERDYYEYKLWKESGADRYLLKHETSNRTLYHKIHPGMKYEERITRLKWLKDLGYQIGSGNIIGLPGQDIKDLARDILLFKELDVHMVGIGPFISHYQTPFASSKNGSIDLTLKTIAITRLLMPRVHLPATTALGTLDPSGRKKALLAGGNVIMPNITAAEYRSLYEIYPGKISTDEKNTHCPNSITKLIKSLDREVGIDYGHSPKGNNFA